MPEFEVTERAREEEFTPNSRTPTSREEPEAPEPRESTANPAHPEARHAALKRGRLPRTVLAARAGGEENNRGMGEIDERESVFSDALAQKLSAEKPRSNPPSRSDAPSPSPRRTRASAKPVADKTTRVLDEHRRELEDVPVSRSGTGSRAPRRSSRGRPPRVSERPSARAKEASSVAEKYDRFERTSCCCKDKKESARDTPCSCRLKSAWAKWWRKFVGCFSSCAGARRAGRRGSGGSRDGGGGERPQRSAGADRPEGYRRRSESPQPRRSPGPRRTRRESP
ncbi:MAG: hypothetical protein LBF21_01820 [Puniceicoccales bacterium]|jgi:hypothetical protein|nr:hypothetical protein [Puniceicoccales bacterium]